MFSEVVSDLLLQCVCVLCISLTTAVSVHKVSVCFISFQNVDYFSSFSAQLLLFLNFYTALVLRYLYVCVTIAIRYLL